MMKKIKSLNDPSTLPKTMHAMVMDVPGQLLVDRILPLPVPLPNQVLIKIIACGVCRTDLHIMDSELSQPKLPLVPGHEIVGTVVQLGHAVEQFMIGDLVGVPWLGFACGHCKYCKREQENLCENALFTGYTMDGGYAEYTVAYADFCFTLPARYGNPSGAPLLCAGLIGYRSYTMTGPHAERLGIYGFGAAAHILIQVALHQGKKIYAFTKDGDLDAQQFAKQLGAEWAGGSSETPPDLLDAAILFAPVGALVPKALKDLDKGGSVVCGGIHMSDIPSFPYELLWEERIIRSVANLTRKDGREFLEVAEQVPVKTDTHLFPLNQANEALAAVRNGAVQGAVVLVM
jgi:propanol-preferring alcohol dehydrogenase